MTRMYYELKFDDVKDLHNGTMSKKINKAIAMGIKDGLLMLEQIHKLKYFIRGGAGSMKTHPTKITWRTGNLAKSYDRYHQGDNHYGYYGTGAIRAPLLEYGGTVHAKPGKSLAIPTQNARVGVGGTLSPRAFPPGELFRGGDGRWLARAKGNNFIELMFWLVKSVYIPPRPIVKKAAKDVETPFQLMMARKVAKAMEK